jgi:hypothetical protein
VSGKSFLVVSLSESQKGGRRVIVEADILETGRTKLKISDVDNEENVIFYESLNESTIEGLQNFFITIRNEMGRNRISSLVDPEEAI